MMSLTCQHVGDEIIISGKTFPIKEHLKAFGARFNPSNKSWIAPYSEINWEGIQAICSPGASAPPSPPTSEPASTNPSPLSAPDTTSGTACSPQKDEPLSVAALILQVATRVSAAFPRPVWVIGEIQNLRRTGGITYMTLAESHQSKSPAKPAYHRGGGSSAPYAVSALLWPRQRDELELANPTLKELLRDGIKVKMQVRVTLYPKRGSLSLEVLDIDPAFTLGEMALKRQEVIRELKKRGVFSANKQRPFPLFPQRIGLISARGSRAYSDFIHQLSTHPRGWEILFCSAAMQGTKTSVEVRQAIKLLEPHCDVLILTRGGGSAVDLHSFNDFDLAHAITQLSKPLLVAIGHHDDECAAQDVAHLELKTPTALADYLLHHAQSLDQRLSELTLTLSEELGRAVEQTHYQLHQLSHRLYERLCASYSTAKEEVDRQLTRMHTTASAALNQQNQKVSGRAMKLFWEVSQKTQRLHHDHQQLSHRLFDGAAARLRKHERQCAHLEKAFASYNPLPWHDRGWTPLSTEAGKRVHLISELAVGQSLTMALSDGLIRAQVTDLKSFPPPLSK